jgi:hypothetical protein
MANSKGNHAAAVGVRRTSTNGDARDVIVEDLPNLEQQEAPEPRWPRGGNDFL